MEIPQVVRSARFFLAVPAVTFTLWAADPTVGSWTLNVAKSRFLSGPAFRAETRTYVEQTDGVKVSIRTTEATGKVVTTEYLAAYDGQVHPVSGAGGPADAVALKKVNEYVAESILLHAGREVATTRRVVSSDLKTMTITYKGLDPRGQQVDYTLVYERKN